MPPVSTESVILRAHPYSETSKILRLLTREHGHLSVIARGARRPKSKYGAILDPFTIGRATFYLREGRDLHTLTDFDLIRTGRGLGLDLTRFGIAALLAEIVLRTGEGEPDPDLYDQVVSALSRLEKVSGEEVEAAGLTEGWALLAHLGYAPVTEYCIGCDRELDDAETVIFDHAAGGVRCEECVGPIRGARHPAGRALPPHARAALTLFLRGEIPSLERIAAHWALLSRFLTYHISEGHRLRSLEFLATVVGDDR